MTRQPTQGSLFGHEGRPVMPAPPIPRPAPPIVHRDDPAPSRQAADAVTRSGIRSRHKAHVLELVRKYPGRTAGELLELSDELVDLYQVRRRLTELKIAGEITRGQARACRVRENAASTWHPTGGRP